MARHPKNPDSTETSGEEGVLQRWARRKSETSLQADPVPSVEPELPAMAEGEGEAPAEPEKTDADMPSLESIHEDSDVSDFFSPGVSEQLRQSALKKLFRSAKFNIVDGLDDYDDDFRNFEALGDIITSDMRHQMELIKERAEEALAAKAEQAPGDGEQPDSAETPVPQAANDETAEPDEAPAESVAAKDGDSGTNGERA